MVRIRIIAVPPGEAPEWVRQAWVGLEFQTSGLLSGTLKEQDLQGVRGGTDVSNAGGYVVNPGVAFEKLSTVNIGAYRWWIRNYAGRRMRQSGRETKSGQAIFETFYQGELIFREDVCKVIG